MNFSVNRLALALSSVALATVVGCGGGGGSAPVEATTVDVSTTVIDGTISNALVCLDKNDNGECDAGEPQGRTNASGNLILKIDKADAGKFRLLTLVGTDAVDADHGPVTEPFAMTSTPGKPGVISPLTTMVAQAMQGGLTEAAAEEVVKEQTGININLFEDFTKNKSTGGGSKPGDVARMIVVTTQEQNKAVKASVGATAADGSAITGQDLRKAVQKRILSLLPAIATASNAASANTTLVDQKARETAVLKAVTLSLMTVEAVKIEVGVEKQAKVADPVTAPTATASFAFLDFSDANNWNRRFLAATAAMNTVDANGLLGFFESKMRRVAGVDTIWSFGGDPGAQQSIQHWNGSTWAPIVLNQLYKSTPRDAAGNNTYNFGDNYETGISTRAFFDISGKTMLSVYTQMIDAGYTNIRINGNPATAPAAVLGSATFPAGSKVSYQTTTTQHKAIGYRTEFNSLVSKNPASVGGDAVADPASICNTPGLTNTQVTTLEVMVATGKGTPCKYAVDTSIAGHPSDSPNEVWGNTTLSIGTVGTAPVLTSSPGSHYTTNTLVRLAFTGGNEVTYYTCKQRQINGASRQCKPTGEKGTFTIATQSDGSRVMTFTNEPAAAQPLTYKRAFVERAGVVYFGFQDKGGVFNTVRLNLEGANAFMLQLGMPTFNPDLPVALTSTSYQGTWEIRDSATPFPFSFNAGIGVTVAPTGGATCFNRTNGLPIVPCTFVITPSTGVVNGTIGTGTVGGTLGYIGGTLTGGTHSGITGVAGFPPSGTLVGGRRF